MDWLRNWRLRRLREKLIAVNAEFASYDFIASATGTHYPTRHRELSVAKVLLLHRIQRLESPPPPANRKEKTE